MKTLKKAVVLLTTALTLNAIGLANASAAEFTSAEAGALTGKALATQKLKLNGGTLECPEVHFAGTASLNGNDSHVRLEFTNCTFVGFPVDVLPLTITTTANGITHIESTTKLSVTAPFFPCEITISGTQTLTGVTYSQNGNNVKVTPNPVKGLKYTSSGGLCGTSGENGEFSGVVEFGLKSGGKVAVDTP